MTIGILFILSLGCAVTNGILFAIHAKHGATLLPTFEPQPTHSNTRNLKRKVRIRSTRKKDIEDVAALLASTLYQPDNEGLNWKASIDKLRRVKSFKELIKNRFDMLCEGKKVASIIDASIIRNECHEAERLRLMWDRESFRHQVQKAAEQAKEPHAWRDHNFALCPQDPSHLQHKMFTVQDVTSGSIVGFCEVAMMLTPESDDFDVNPTIANLVTSPEFRRCGIGSSLLESVKRYVKQNWKSDNLALYVKRSNAKAIGLYQKQGFDEFCQIDDSEDCYMILRPSENSRVI